jgi:Listeria-Bacteroides repeat domain (List_Bact_rpt).
LFFYKYPREVLIICYVVTSIVVHSVHALPPKDGSPTERDDKMKRKNMNEGEDSSILRRKSHKMRMTAILMFAVALLAITAVSISDSGESDAATGTVVSGTADITLGVTTWDDTMNLVFVATYGGSESFVGITAAYATSGSVTIPVTRTSANVLGPAAFLITDVDLAAASLSPGDTITITFAYAIYDEVVITDAGGDFNVGGYTSVVAEGGSYYLERGQSGTINFTLAPSGLGYYRSTATVSAGITTDISIYTTDFTATLVASSAPYTIDLTAVEMYMVTVGAAVPTGYAYNIQPAANETVGPGFRNLTGNVGYVDVGQSGSFELIAFAAVDYYRFVDITGVDVPFVPGVYTGAVTCTVTPVDSTATVVITMTEMYEVTVGIPSPTEYTVYFVSAADGLVGDGFRNVTGNIGYVDAGYIGTFYVNTVMADPFYRIMDITNIDTPYVPGILDTSATCTVTPVDSTTVVGITVTEVYMVTVGVPAPTEYTVTPQMAVNVTVDHGFRSFNANVGYVDAGYTGTFTVDTVFSDPYFRILDITNTDSPYTPGASEITATCDVTPTDSTTVVGITVTEMYMVTVGVAVPTEYGVTFTMAADELVGPGFRNVTGNIGYVDATFIGTFLVYAIFTDPFYRILDITNIDAPYTPGVFEVTAICTVTPTDSTTVVGITMVELYMVTVGAPSPTGYAVTFVPAGDGLVGPGFRNVTGNIGYVDATFIGTFTVDTVFTNPYYRLAEITSIDAAYVPGILEITAICTVTPIDSTTVVGITAIQVYEITFSAGTGTSYYPVSATAHNVGSNGFRQDPFTAAVDVFYVDTAYTAYFTAESDFLGPYYRLVEITNVDTPYVPGMLDILVVGVITPVADETILISAVEVYEIIVDCNIGGVYSVTDATVHDVAADGFRQTAIPTPDVYYIDAGQEGVATITANSGYRIMDVTAGNAALPLHYGSSYVVYSLTYTLEPVNDVTLTIVFKKVWTVTLDSNPAEGGTVTGGGIHDDSSVIVINAIANDGYKFLGWSDGSKTVNRLIAINSNTFLTALFEKEPVMVTVWVIAEEGGSVTGGGKIVVGSSFTISAKADSGYEFVKWSDGSTSATRTLTATSDATYIAEFSENADSSDNWDIILIIIIIIVVVIIVAVILFLIFGRKKNEY